MKVVLDTNVLLVAIPFGTPYYPIFDAFLNGAVAANADFIVSNDRHFQVLKDVAFPAVRVISADDFVEILTGVRPSKV